MNTVIATDGSLSAEDVLPYVTPLSGGDTVTVLTVVEVPRTLLNDIRGVYGATSVDPVETDAEYVAAGGGSTPPAARWPGDDAIIER